MEFKCKSCRSRFSEWGKKKGKFGDSINCCPNCGETDCIYAWNEEKKNGKNNIIMCLFHLLITSHAGFFIRIATISKSGIKF